MSMYTLIRNNQQPSMKDIEDSLGGTLFVFIDYIYNNILSLCISSYSIMLGVFSQYMYIHTYIVHKLPIVVCFFISWLKIRSYFSMKDDNYYILYALVQVISVAALDTGPS